MSTSSAPSRIYIKNLPSSLSLEEFRKHFSQQAPLTDAKFLSRRRIGYAGYKTSEDAERAVKYFHKSFLGLAKLNVEIARPIQETGGPARKRRRLENEGSHTREQEQSADNLCANLPEGCEHVNEKVVEPQSELKECIQTTYRPHKNKIWQNHEETFGASVDDQTPKTEQDLSAESTQIVTAKKTSTKRRVISKRPASESEVPSLPETPIADDKTTTIQIIPDRRKDDLLHDAAVATNDATSDADWLRSRTSRLLGLVDDDQVINERLYEGRRANTLIRSHDRSVSRSEEPPTESAEMNGNPKAEDGKEESPPLNTHMQEDHRSSRLFVRNLTYTAIEEDLRAHFSSTGHGIPIEVRCPLS